MRPIPVEFCFFQFAITPISQWFPAADAVTAVPAVCRWSHPLLQAPEGDKVLEKVPEGIRVSVGFHIFHHPLMEKKTTSTTQEQKQ